MPLVGNIKRIFSSLTIKCLQCLINDYFVILNLTLGDIPHCSALPSLTQLKCSLETNFCLFTISLSILVCLPTVKTGGWLDLPCTLSLHFIGLYKAEAYECWNLKETGAHVFVNVFYFFFLHLLDQIGQVFLRGNTNINKSLMINRGCLYLIQALAHILSCCHILRIWDLCGNIWRYTVRIVVKALSTFFHLPVNHLICLCVTF